MILYAVSYKGELTNDEWSIVTIHKSLEGATKAKEQYENNVRTQYGTLEDCKYDIKEIDTDIDQDCVYDCDYE